MNFSGVVLSVFLSLLGVVLHCLLSHRTKTDLAKLNDTNRLKTQEDETHILHLLSKQPTTGGESDMKIW